MVLASFPEVVSRSYNLNIVMVKRDSAMLDCRLIGSLLDLRRSISAANILLFLVIGIRLADITSSVEPDRPSLNRALAGTSSTPRPIHRLADVITGNYSSEVNERHLKWAESAYLLVQRIDCAARNNIHRRSSHTWFASTSTECLELQRLRRDQMNVYIADTNHRGRLKTVLPDGVVESPVPVEGVSGPAERPHGVVVLDPYPEANFGHLVIVFHVTSGVTEAWCGRRDGAVIGHGDCLTLAVKSRCHNLVAPRSNRRNFDRRCEINFIPLVTVHESTNSSIKSRHQHSRLPDDDNDHNDDVTTAAEPRQHRHNRNREQLLLCRTDLPGFKTICPSLRSRNSTSGSITCNPLRENSKRCETTREALRRDRSERLQPVSPPSSVMPPSISASASGCRVFEICDQAVIISGGWNAWSHRKLHADNVARFYAMLRDHGFRSGNIKVFFANGASDIPPYDADALNDMYSATQKMVIRNHIQNLCQSVHCVDSLVIYFNSPTMSDGTVLLWDADLDGLASETERYSLSELRADLSGCDARHVHVIVDQSYSGEASRSLRRARPGLNLRQVGIYSSGRDNEYSFGDDFTSAWTRLNHTRMCTKDVFRETRRTMRLSHPQMQLGDESAANVNIFGAPCGVQPPFNHDELRQNYLGCQSLPTALWMMKLRKHQS